MTRSLAVLALLVLAGCESERTIPTRAHPEGETIPCIGVAAKHERPGIDYDLSARNVPWALFGVEFLAPPVMVLHHETFCPIADTSHAIPRRSA